MTKIPNRQIGDGGGTVHRSDRIRCSSSIILSEKPWFVHQAHRLIFLLYIIYSFPRKFDVLYIMNWNSVCSRITGGSLRSCLRPPAVTVQFPHCVCSVSYLTDLTQVHRTSLLNVHQCNSACVFTEDARPVACGEHVSSMVDGLCYDPGRYQGAVHQLRAPAHRLPQEHGAVLVEHRWNLRFYYGSD